MSYRITRKARKSYSIGLFPGAAATGLISKGSMTAIPMIHVYGIASGIALFYGGLFVFNRKLAAYREAKARNDVKKQNEIVDIGAKNLRKRVPQMSEAQSRKVIEDVLIQKSLEKDRLERQKKSGNLDNEKETDDSNLNISHKEELKKRYLEKLKLEYKEKIKNKNS